MNPVYDLSSEHDRLRLAVAMMRPEQRDEFCRRIRQRYGLEAETKLKEGLRDELTNRISR